MESVPCHPQWLNMSRSNWAADQSFESECYQFQSLKRSRCSLSVCVSLSLLYCPQWQNEWIGSTPSSRPSLTLYSIDRGARLFFTLDGGATEPSSLTFIKVDHGFEPMFRSFSRFVLKWKTNRRWDRYTEGVVNSLWITVIRDFHVSLTKLIWTDLNSKRIQCKVLVWSMGSHISYIRGWKVEDALLHPREKVFRWNYL